MVHERGQDRGLGPRRPSESIRRPSRLLLSSLTTLALQLGSTGPSNHRPRLSGLRWFTRRCCSSSFSPLYSASTPKARRVPTSPTPSRLSPSRLPLPLSLRVLPLRLSCPTLAPRWEQDCQQPRERGPSSPLCSSSCPHLSSAPTLRSLTLVLHSKNTCVSSTPPTTRLDSRSDRLP